MLNISLLGPFAVTQNNEPAIGFKTDYSRAILAFTAYHRGVPQRRDALAGMLWPDDPNDKALKKFRVELNRLRPVIGDADADPPHYFINRKEIEFNPDSQAAVDVVEFETLLDEVRMHGHRTLPGCPSCIGKLERAAELYQGEFMAGFHLNSDVWQQWLTKQREGFKLQALELFGTLCTIQQERGEWDAVLALAQKQIGLDPWYEDGYQALMRASYSLGDRAGAMGWYEACERVLYEELGVDPSAETLDLQQQILDDELDVDAPAALSIPDNLPEQSGRFFGRKAEIKQLQELLVNPNHRLVTLVGAGGIGKTRLSIEAGQTVKESFPDGVWFVQLAEVSGGMERIKVAIGEAAGLNQNNDGKQLSGDQVIAILREKKMLLILDNSEYVLNDIAFIPEWLRRAPGVAILASSREPLNFQTETTVHLTGLALDVDANTVEEAGAAVGLFGERGQMARSDFEVTNENLPQVHEICQMVGGSPLAISLAAAWLRRRALDQIIESINQSLDFLTSRMRDIDPRHRSMRAVFETSWQLLEPEDQVVFAALSVFPGSFSVDAAQKVAGIPLDDLDILCEKSLLMQQHKEKRYLMHGLLRQFAVGKLNELHLSDQFEVAFTSYFYSYAQQHRADYEALRPEWGNFSAGIEIAHKHAASESVLDFTDALSEAWQKYCRYQDAGRAFDLADSAANKLGAEEKAALNLLRWSETIIEQNQYDSAWEKLETAQKLFLKFEQSIEIARTKYFQGYVLFDQGEFKKAEKVLLESLEIMTAEGNAKLECEVLNLLGWLYFEADNDLKRGKDFAFEVLSKTKHLSDSIEKISSLRRLSFIEMREGNIDQAEIYSMQALESSERQNNLGETGATIYNLIPIHIAKEDFDQAKLLAEKGLTIFRNLGNIKYEAMISLYLSVIHLKLSAFAEAKTFAETASTIFQSIQDRVGYGFALRQMGDILTATGQDEQAKDYWMESLSLAEHLDHTELKSQLSSRLNPV